MKVSGDSGNIYHSLEQNQLKGNFIILNDSEVDDVKDKEGAVPEMTVANELQSCRPEPRLRVSLKSVSRLV